VADWSVGIIRRGTGKSHYSANLICRKCGRTATSGVIGQHRPDQLVELLIILFRFDLCEDFSVFCPAFSPEANRLSPDVQVLGYVFIARPRFSLQDDSGSKRLGLGTEAAAYDLSEHGPLLLGQMDLFWLRTSGFGHVPVSPVIPLCRNFGKPAGNDRWRACCANRMPKYAIILEYDH